MITHEALGTIPFTRSRRLYLLVRWGWITTAGHKKLKIYGTLHCPYGKRMLLKNRIFFSGIEEAEAAGYRPCGHCQKERYRQWKQNR